MQIPHQNQTSQHIPCVRCVDAEDVGPIVHETKRHLKRPGLISTVDNHIIGHALPHLIDFRIAFRCLKASDDINHRTEESLAVLERKHPVFQLVPDEIDVQQLRSGNLLPLPSNFAKSVLDIAQHTEHTDEAGHGQTEVILDGGPKLLERKDSKKPRHTREQQ